MDYKVFQHDYDQTKKPLSDFINLRNKQNTQRADKMVSEYLAQMAEGDYSLKSYKAKIIHNEMDFNHAKRDIMPIYDKVFKDLTDLVEAYFEEYLESLKEVNVYANKTKDLREFVQDNRHQKHDVLLKKNNVEKEFNAKSKELEQQKNDKYNSYNEKMNSLKNRLSNDIKKINEKAIKDYNEYELQLLDCDEIKKIKELKEKIKEIRSASLDDEYNLKVETYETLMNEEITFNNTYYDFVRKFEDYKKENKEKLLESELINNKLTLASEYRDKEYDVEELKRLNDRFKEEIDKFNELVKNHNEYISHDYSEYNYSFDDKLYLFDLSKIKILEFLLVIHKDDRFNPVGDFLINLMEYLNKEKAYYKQVLESIKPSFEAKSAELVKGLEPYTPNPKKKVTKEEYVDNVVSSLGRYYDNVILEVDFFNGLLFDYIDKLLNLLITNYDKVVEDSKKYQNNNKEILLRTTNYNYFDLFKYGYTTEVVEDTVLEDGTVRTHNDDLNDNLNGFIGNLLQSYNTSNDEYNNKLALLKEENDNNIKALENDYNDKLLAIQKEYTEATEKNTVNVSAKEKESRKATAKYKDNAKKLLHDSKQAL